MAEIYYMCELDPARLSPQVRIAHRAVIPAGEVIATRVIYDCELVYLLTGGGRVVVGEHAYTAHPGELFFVPPGVANYFAAGANEAFDHLALHFDLYPRSRSPRQKPEWTEQAVPPTLPAGFPALLPSHLVFPGRLALSAPQTFLNRAFAIIHTFAEPSFGAPLTAKALMLEFLIDLQKEVFAQTREHLLPWVAETMTFIEEHLAEPLSVAALARRVGFHPTYFNRLFHRVTGYAVGEYITTRRLARARLLLRTTPTPVGEIAAAVGYPDLPSFSRLFKKYEGLSPRKYRETLSL